MQVDFEPEQLRLIEEAYAHADKTRWPTLAAFVAHMAVMGAEMALEFNQIAEMEAGNAAE